MTSPPIIAVWGPLRLTSKWNRPDHGYPHRPEFTPVMTLHNAITEVIDEKYVLRINGFHPTFACDLTNAPPNRVTQIDNYGCIVPLANNWLSIAATQFDALSAATRDAYLHPTWCHHYRYARIHDGNFLDELDGLYLDAPSASSPESIVPASSSSSSTPSAVPASFAPLTATAQARVITDWWQSLQSSGQIGEVSKFRVLEIAIMMGFVELVAAWVRLSGKWVDLDAYHSHPVRFQSLHSTVSLSWSFDTKDADSLERESIFDQLLARTKSTKNTSMTLDQLVSLPRTGDIRPNGFVKDTPLVDLFRSIWSSDNYITVDERYITMAQYIFTHDAIQNNGASPNKMGALWAHSLLTATPTSCPKHHPPTWRPGGRARYLREQHDKQSNGKASNVSEECLCLQIEKQIDNILSLRTLPHIKAVPLPTTLTDQELKIIYSAVPKQDIMSVIQHIGEIEPYRLRDDPFEMTENDAIAWAENPVMLR
jgi:hypothetical protein